MVSGCGMGGPPQSNPPCPDNHRVHLLWLGWQAPSTRGAGEGLREHSVPGPAAEFASHVRVFGNSDPITARGMM